MKAATGKFRSRKEPKQRRRRREPEISEEERELRELLGDGAAEADATRLEEVYARLDAKANIDVQSHLGCSALIGSVQEKHHAGCLAAVVRSWAALVSCS